MYAKYKNEDLKAEYRDLVNRILELDAVIEAKADALNALLLMDDDRQSFHAESVQNEIVRLESKVTQLRAVHFGLAEMLVTARNELNRRNIDLLEAFMEEEPAEEEPH